MMPRYLAQPCPLSTPPTPPLFECMILRCLAQPCPLPLSFLPPQAVVCGLDPLG